MLKVFVSWSGERSRLMAKAVTEWLPRVIQVIEPWMSDENLSKGELWSTELSRTLAEHTLGILCLTPENYQAPWLLFEAGALSKLIGDSKVCPLILGMTPEELEGPLSAFQATVVEKDDMFKLVKSLNDELGESRLRNDILRDSFERFWPDLEIRMVEIASITIPGTTSQVMSAVRALAKYGLTDPQIGAHAFFSNGFESHALYTTVTSIATTRLYIFGRKNRKLFDKDHKNFFAGLPHKIETGFDFRVLFLDPASSESLLGSAHGDDDFVMQLESNIAHVYSTMKRHGLNAEMHCRKYALNRKHAIIIVDDAVIYSPIEYDKDGHALPLTNVKFNVVNASSLVGVELVESFLSVWDSAKPF